MNLPLVINVLVFVALLLLLAQTRHKQWSLAKKVLVGLVVGVVFGLGLQLVYGADNPVLKESISWFNIVGKDQYVKNGAVKHALVIGADVLSRTLDPEDRGTIILFGDGAGAVVLGASEEQGILSTHLHADGSYGSLLTLPYKDRQNQDKPAYVTMAGNEVFKVAVTELARIVDETLQANNMDRSELDWLVPHQANLRIISATAKKLGMGMDKVVVTLDRHGNTSAASVPSALDEAVRDGRIQRGQRVLLEAFGGGFTWGSALVRF